MNKSEKKKKHFKSQSFLTCFATLTYRPDGQFWWVVVDVSDGYERRGRVGEPKVQIALHVRGLDDNGVLRHFL